MQIHCICLCYMTYVWVHMSNLSVLSQEHSLNIHSFWAHVKMNILWSTCAYPNSIPGKNKTKISQRSGAMQCFYFNSASELHIYWLHAKMTPGYMYVVHTLARYTENTWHPHDNRHAQTKAVTGKLHRPAIGLNTKNHNGRYCWVDDGGVRRGRGGDIGREGGRGGEEVKGKKRGQQRG